MISWARQQATKTEFTLIIKSSRLRHERRSPMLVLDCEINGMYKGTKKKLNREKTCVKGNMNVNLDCVVICQNLMTSNLVFLMECTAIQWIKLKGHLLVVD